MAVLVTAGRSASPVHRVREGDLRHDPTTLVETSINRGAPCGTWSAA